jgi:hypothetical protein
MYHSMNICLQVCSNSKYADPKRLEWNENGRCRIGHKVLYNNFPPLSDETSNPPYTLYCPKYDKNHRYDHNYLAAVFVNNSYINLFQ